MKYCAIIGDVVNSRHIEKRQDFQNDVKNILSDINNEYHASIASNFTLTLGDEFQGLLNDASISYEIIKKLKERLSPERMRFGIGIGQMDTSFDRSVSIGSDGDAYRYAREMVIRLKKEETRRHKHTSILICSGHDDDALLNALICLIDSQKSQRTKYQQELIQYADEGYSQKEIAKRVGTTQSAVSKALNTASYYQIKYGEEELVKGLSALWEK